MSAEYRVNLPVVIKIDDRGAVTLEVDTTEAGAEIGWEHPHAPSEHVRAVEAHHQWSRTIPQRVLQARAEIEADIEAGRVPTDISSFEDLHDWVDANEYGGLTDLPLDTEADAERALKILERVQAALDAWLKAGRSDAAVPEFFGAVADGHTDDTDAIRAALDHAIPDEGIDVTLRRRPR